MDGVEALDAAGTATAGALLAREAERAHAPGHFGGHDPATACANCGTPLAGPFCSACGQHGHVHRTAGALLHDLLHGVFHFEGKLWATLPMLAWRPGELTRRYVQGERAKFVSPVALFLFSVFLMFAVLSNLSSGPLADVGQGWSDSSAKKDAGETLAGARAKLREALAEADRDIALGEERVDRLGGDPAQVATVKKERARLEDLRAERAVVAAAISPLTPATGTGATKEGSRGWLGQKLQTALSNPELLAYKIKNSAYKWSWVLIPISLPFIWLLFPFRRDVGMYDHAIFAIFSLSFMSLLAITLATFGALGLPPQVVALAWLMVPPVHLYRHLKGSYRLGRFGALWRTALMMVFATAASLLFLSLLLYLSAS